MAKPLKIYPSSIAQVHGVSVSGYNNSCLRYLTMRDELPKTEIAEIYRIIGRLGEIRTIEGLKRAKPNNKLEEEVSFTRPLGDNVLISGRVDVVDPTAGEIHEIKTSISQSKYYSQVCKPQELPPYAHIAQLVTYLHIFGYARGYIHFNYTHFNGNLDALEFESMTYQIDIVDNDSIVVNGVVYTHSVADILQYYALAKRALINPELPPKSINEKACEVCPLRRVCKENAKDKASFSRLVKKHGLEEVLDPVSDPKIPIHNVKRRVNK